MRLAGGSSLVEELNEKLFLATRSSFSLKAFDWIRVTPPPPGIVVDVVLVLVVPGLVVDVVVVPPPGVLAGSAGSLPASTSSVSKKPSSSRSMPTRTPLPGGAQV